MKTASKTMYTIGMVYAIIFLITGATLLLIGGILLGFSFSPEITDAEAKAAYAAVSAGMLAFGGYFAAGQIVEIVMDNLGRKGGRGVQIANIVLGAIFSNIFTLLGGAFGLVSDDLPTVNN